MGYITLVQYEIEIYKSARGKCPFSKWLRDLADIKARARIKVRLDRLKLGNFGDCESLGDGVSELKMDFGPGYRVYFGKTGNQCVLLLCGGSKRTQSKNIEKAKEYFEDYKRRL